MTVDEPRGLECFVDDDPPSLICMACGISRGYPDLDQRDVGWSLHVLLVHWEQAGMSEPVREGMLTAYGEAMLS